MKPEYIAAASLAALVAINSNPQPEITPAQQNRIAVASACNHLVSEFLGSSRSTAGRYAMQGCVTGYYALKEALAYSRR